jgi:hypothetical protein
MRETALLVRHDHLATAFEDGFTITDVCLHNGNGKFWIVEQPHSEPTLRL